MHEILELTEILLQGTVTTWSLCYLSPCHCNRRALLLLPRGAGLYAPLPACTVWEMVEFGSLLWLCSGENMVLEAETCNSPGML